MPARFLALVCLLYVSIPTARAQLLDGGDVAVYLKAADSHSGPALDSMKTELESLMRSVGVDLHWWNRTAGEDVRTGELVVLELHGACEAPLRTEEAAPFENMSLGSSPVMDGFVQPFSRVDCETLTRFIGPSLNGLAHEEADRFFGRAMARVAAHELYHVLSGKSHHAQTGVAKAEFTRADLLGDRFAFEDTVTADNPHMATTGSAPDSSFYPESSGK